jgi:hypothetical protein
MRACGAALPGRAASLRITPTWCTGNKQELCQKIVGGQYCAPEYLTDGMKDLLARMLTVDPDKRITFSQVPACPALLHCRGTGACTRCPGSTSITLIPDDMLRLFWRRNDDVFCVVLPHVPVITLSI